MRLRPEPSEPTTSASGRRRSASQTGTAASVFSAPATVTPSSLNLLSAFLMFVTRQKGMCSLAPADAFTASGVSPAERRSCVITPAAPAASAVRIMAPRFLGSSTWSRTMYKGCLPDFPDWPVRSSSSSRVRVRACSASAATP